MASMRDIQRRRNQYRQHTADHKSHEAGVYREAAESQEPCRADEPVFPVYVPDSDFHAGEVRHDQSPVSQEG